jgi:DNA-binding CsgD family transcriptional regulator
VSALAAALDEIDYALLLVDLPSGRVRHSNRQALVEWQRHGTLEWPDGIAQAADSTGQRAWLGALVAAAGGRRSLITLRARPDALLEDPQLTSVAVSVAVVPLPSDGTTGPMQASVVFGKRQVADALSVGFFSRLHALTPTEDAVLLGLCRGLKPSEIAVSHGVAISTVRTHVNAIRLKTGTCSIRELVHKVSTLPPMAPAVRADEL